MFEFNAQGLNHLQAIRSASDLFVVIQDTLTEAVHAAWDKARNDPVAPIAVAGLLEPIYAAFDQAAFETKSSIADALAAVSWVVWNYKFMEAGPRAFEIMNAVRRYYGEIIPGDDPPVDPAYVPPSPEAD